MADLVNFIEYLRRKKVPLSMAELNDMSEKRLSSLGWSSSSHTTRLCENILRIIPDITEVQKPNGWNLVFDEDLSQVVNDMSKQASSKLITLAKLLKLYEPIHLLRNNSSLVHLQHHRKRNQYLKY